MRLHKPPVNRSGGPINTCTPHQSSDRAATALLQAALSVTLITGPAWACWQEAADRYGLSTELLLAIARTESSLNPQAIGRNADGSRDIGLMQINSTWLPVLARYGIHEHDLLHPCTSLQVGAWILAGNVQRLGYSWEAVGAYNARTPAKRQAYVRRVQRQLSLTSASSPTPHPQQ